MTRIKISFGSSHVNKGTRTVLIEDKFKPDHSRLFYLLDVIPMGAVRMSSSDRWKTNPNHVDPNKRQRESVTRYFKFKDQLREQTKLVNFELGRFIDAIFFVPMPDSWSDKKKEKMNGMPCDKRPDCDNYLKALADTLREEDGDIWTMKAEKRYAWKGSILIYG